MRLQSSEGYAKVLMSRSLIALLISVFVLIWMGFPAAIEVPNNAVTMCQTTPMTIGGEPVTGNIETTVINICLNLFISYLFLKRSIVKNPAAETAGRLN